MREYVITVNSTVDLPKEWLEERHVSVLPMKYTIDGETYVDMEGLSAKEFFAKLREGKMSVTSQVNPEEAKSYFESFLKEGKDVLHLSFSSALSGTYNSMRIAKEELEEIYPEAKIIIIDTLCACMGEGLLLYKALQQKEAGKNIEEVAEWVEENKLHICHNVTVDDLHHLHRGGRISKATAVLGTMVQIKPIIYMAPDGSLQVIGKERGRKKSLQKIVNMAAEQIKGWEEQNDLVMITHGDCIEDAEYVAGLVRERLGIDQILIHNIGTVIGSHTGPGVVALFLMGEKR
ncbi:MAG: DegV family protein [Ruminococcus sp.]|nr:DegV family protein [Ruminococcus sp.]